MDPKSFTDSDRRAPVTFTIRADIIAEARSLGLNASRAAERGLQAEIAMRRREDWLRENQSSIHAHNQRVLEKGTLIKPHWASS